MVQTAARLFQRDGYHATSWRGLVEEADAPWGSIHHHFPGGKEELGLEAVRLGASAVDAMFEHCFDTHDDPAEAVAAAFALSADLMVGSDYETGCPVATVALETVATPGPLRDAARDAFGRWEATLARRFRRAGVRRPRETATGVLALFEGALLLSRVRRDRRPMQLASRQARLLID